MGRVINLGVETTYEEAFAKATTLKNRKVTGPKPVLADVVTGTTGAVSEVETGLEAPITVSRDSGSTEIYFSASGSKIIASIAASLNVGASLSAVAQATQADGSGFVVPFTLTGIAVPVVIHVPAAPSVALTAGDGQISIAWTDGSNGGATITAHRIYVNGTGMSPITSASPFVLTGLANDVAVSIEVTAINSVGESARSAAQSVTPVAGGASGPSLQITASSILESALSGSTVGVLSVANGSGTYTFTKTADPDGKFAVSGSNLNTAAGLDFETAQSHSVTISASNGVDDPIVRTFTISVTNVPENPGMALYREADGTVTVYSLGVASTPSLERLNNSTVMVGA